MAKYWWSAADAPVQSGIPAGWTNRFATSATHEVITDAASPEGRSWRIVTTAQARRALSFDAVSADAGRADARVAILFKNLEDPANAIKFTALARGAGSVGSETGVAAGVGSSGGADALHVAQYNAGTFTTKITTNNAAVGFNVWFWCVAEYSGSNVTVSLRYAATPDTVVATTTATNLDLTAAGWVGLFNFSTGRTWDVAAFAVATGADDIFFEDPNAGPDITAPTLTSPTATATGETTYSGTVTTDEANGTLYWLVNASASATGTEVKAGASQAVSTTGVQNVSGSGLTHSTSYYVHYLHRDAAGNDSTVSTSAQFTTTVADVTAPVLTLPTGTATGQTTADGTVTTDEANGTLYAVVTASATPPSAADMRTGTGAVYATSQAVIATGVQSVAATGLTADTAYYWHFLHDDAAANASNIATSASFTTDAEAVVVKGVRVTLYSVDVAQASITGITARWWDSATATGAPLLKTDTASTDATGLLEINLDAATSLAVGGMGYLSLYKAGADVQSDLHFASRIAVQDIA